MKIYASKAGILIMVLLLVTIMSLQACSDGGSSSQTGNAIPTMNALAEAQLDLNANDTSSALDESQLTRTTRFGSVKGKVGDADTYEWLGIPYAKPPVGDLRWRTPQDPEPWDGVLDTDHFCSFCPQFGNFISETGEDSLGGIWAKGVLVGKEDCLYLNIWRPQTDEENLPVFVFIHGGANVIGRSDLSIYNGANFASRQNMVFVTVNYRLGTLGWFAHPALRTGDPEQDSGNFGTLDLIKSLEWIQENISAFGGNPGNVTICGQSAGGINIYSLMASPLAKGLFNRAIPMSGFPQSYPMTVAEPRALTVGTRLLIQDGAQGDINEVVKQALQKGETWVADYLRSKTLEEIYPPYLAGPVGFNLDTLVFVESSMGIYEDGYVVPKNPLECFADGDYNHVPLLLGCTKEELKLFLPFMLVDPGVLFDFMKTYDPDNPEFRLEDLLKPAYYPVLPAYDSIARVGQLIFQGEGVDTTATTIREHQEAVYAYKFAWDEEPEPFDFFLGAGHAMDIPFVFGNFIRSKDSLTSFAWSEANREGREKLSDAMMTYFAQFARTGNPNPPDSDLLEWTPWSNEEGAPKRIIFDTGELYMSPDAIEPDEVPSLLSMISEVIRLLQNR